MLLQHGCEFAPTGVSLHRRAQQRLPIPMVILPFMKHGDLHTFLLMSRLGDEPFVCFSCHFHTHTHMQQMYIRFIWSIPTCKCLLMSLVSCRASLSRFLSSSCWILLEGWSISATKTSSIGIWLLATACEFFFKSALCKII